MSTKKYFDGLYDSDYGIVKIKPFGKDVFNVKFFNGNSDLIETNTEILYNVYRVKLISPLKAIDLGINESDAYTKTIKYMPFVSKLRNDEDLNIIFREFTNGVYLNDFDKVWPVYFGDKETYPNNIRCWFDVNVYDNEDGSENGISSNKEVYVPENLFMALEGDLCVLYPPWREAIIKKNKESYKKGLETELEKLNKKIKEFE